MSVRDTISRVFQGTWASLVLQHLPQWCLYFSPTCAPQPLLLSQPVHALLLAMCEDQPCRRRPLQSVLEACRVHEEEMTVCPAPASLHVRRLVGLVLGTISEVQN